MTKPELSLLCFLPIIDRVEHDRPEPIGINAESVIRRAKIIKEHQDAVEKVKERAQMAYGELVLNEIEFLFMCGIPKGKAYLPAVNNLALRRQQMQDELIAEIARLQVDLREKLSRLEG